jgi:SAM-dependent methyltransferase
MKMLSDNSLAAMEFALKWQSPEARHIELYYGPNVNMWRDIFPVGVKKKILGARENETFTFTFNPGTVVPGYSPARVLDISPGQFGGSRIPGQEPVPRAGRFYPSGLLRNVDGVFPQSLTPFRVIDFDGTRIRVDLNHPLSRQALELKLRIRSIRQSPVERGGRCTDWLEEVTADGPGMQARANREKTVFQTPGSYNRPAEEDDSLFYAAPRLVGHIDSQASSMLCNIYTRFLNKNETVLDLMSSVQSHLPENFGLTTTGLGLNREELKNNPALHTCIIQDLNKTTRLPFASNTFNVVLCSLSIEYLTSPQKIIDEIRRILIPGGRVLIGFSNRWFPPKVTRLWLEIHAFERLGLVLDYLLGNGGFSEFYTYSARNWPRPPDDVHADTIATSDPIFVVAGSKNIQQTEIPAG